MNTASDASTLHQTVERAMTARDTGNAASRTGTPPGIADPGAVGAPMPTTTGRGAAS